MSFSFSTKPVLYKNKSYLFLANIFAIALVASVLIFFGWGADQVEAPIEDLNYQRISLDFGNLLFYGLRTTFRMIIGITISITFSILYATLAAKNQKAEQILIPVLDILQSVPILGYISFTVAGFVALAPNTVLGFEMVAIFAIFTSQAWNITFSVYQSLKKVPTDLLEVAASYNFSSWRKFWVIEIPCTIPGIIWNTIVSMSGAWFFVVAAETITYQTQKIQLPGIGSYISVALKQQNFNAIIVAILAMVLIIFLFDRLVFRSLVIWSNKFRYESENNAAEDHYWFLSLLLKSFLIRYIVKIFKAFGRFIVNLPMVMTKPISSIPKVSSKWFDLFWYSSLVLVALYAMSYVIKFLSNSISLNEIIYVFGLTGITLIRLVILLIIASIIFVPIGIYVGRRPSLCSKIQPLVQFLSAFPANLFFPAVVIYVNKYNLNPDIWLSPLMIIAAQWYILFNVIAGTSQIPSEFKEVAATFQITGWLRYKKIIFPAIMPYYITGMITAAGAAWNASIVSEAVTWGTQNIYAHGIGSYITQMTAENNFPKIVLGVIVMSTVVVVLNKIFWGPIYDYVTNKYSYI
jgi:NitT/TauT family transport system permease protein